MKGTYASNKAAEPGFEGEGFGHDNVCGRHWGLSPNATLLGSFIVLEKC
jgi:hypothetical protein